MKCKSCGTRNQDGARFCRLCGTLLSLRRKNTLTWVFGLMLLVTLPILISTAVKYSDKQEKLSALSWSSYLCQKRVFLLDENRYKGLFEPLNFRGNCVYKIDGSDLTITNDGEKGNCEAVVPLNAKNCRMSVVAEVLHSSDKLGFGVVFQNDSCLYLFDNFTPNYRSYLRKIERNTGKDTYLDLAEDNPGGQKGRRYHLEMVVENGKLYCYRDGRILLSAEDRSLEAGSFFLLLWPGTKVCFSNLWVINMDSN